jgi:hypothetical protein
MKSRYLIFSIILFLFAAVSSAQTSAAYKATCTEKYTDDPYGGMPILTKTCFYKKFKTVAKGYPDRVGRYSYNFSIYSKQANGKYVQIKNENIFNQDKDELLSMVNAKIENDYKLFVRDPENAPCFEGFTYSPYTFEQMGITFEDNQILFQVTFGLPSLCMSLDGTIVTFGLADIQKYLKN